jgi:hypothetical protein
VYRSCTMHFAANGFLDDMLLGNQKNRNRKWKSWTTVLTTSQLLIFSRLQIPDPKCAHQDMFRFVSPSRHQYILQADIPEDADLWITLINYAGVFRTSGLHMRTKRAKNGINFVPHNSYGEHEPAGNW